MQFEEQKTFLFMMEKIRDDMSPFAIITCQRRISRNE